MSGKRKWQLSRREFLKCSLGGAGTLVSLPLLEAMIPPMKTALAQSTGADRFVFMFVPNGYRSSEWNMFQNNTPLSGPGSQPYSSIFQPLSGLTQYIRVQKGLSTAQRILTAHTEASGFVATGVQPVPGPFNLAMTIDQHIRGHLQTNSFHLAAENQTAAEAGISDECSRTVACQNATTRIPNEMDPVQAFNSLFSGSSAVQSRRQALLRSLTGRSIVDYVREDAQKLKAVLGKSDNDRLNSYLESIRQLETSLTTYTQSSGGGGCQFPSPAPFSDISQRMDRLLDVIVMGLQCGQSRVATMMFGSELGHMYGLNPANPVLSDHTVSHYQDNPSYPAIYNQNRVYLMQKVANFTNNLIGIPVSGGGNLLDKTVIVVTTALNMAPHHSFSGSAMVITGDSRVARNTISYQGNRNISDLYRAIARQIFGMPTIQFGSGSSEINLST